MATEEDHHASVSQSSSSDADLRREILFDSLSINHWLNSHHAQSKRWRFESSFQWRHTVKKFWRLLKKEDDSHQLEREIFLNLNMMISKSLFPSWNLKEAKKKAKREWTEIVSSNDELKGKKSMRFDQFSEFLYQIVEFWVGKSIQPFKILEFTDSLFDHLTVSVPNSIFEGRESSWEEEDEPEEGEEEKQFPETQEMDPFSHLLIHHQFMWRSIEEISSFPLKAPKNEKNSVRKSYIESKLTKQTKKENDSSYSEGSSSDEEEEEKQKNTLDLPQLDELSDEELKSIFQSRLLKTRGGTRSNVSLGHKHALNLSSKKKETEGKKPRVIIVVGPRGSGKTNLSKELSKHFGMIHLDLVEQLQNHIEQKNSPINTFLSDGRVLDQDFLFDLLDSLVHTEEGLFKGYVLDGIPSDVQQLRKFESFDERFRPDYLIELEVENGILIERLSGTQVDPQSGRFYSPLLLKDKNLWEEDDNSIEEIQERLVELPTHSVEHLSDSLSKWSSNFSSFFSFPNLSFVLIEASQKEAEVAEEAIGKLGGIEKLINPLDFEFPDGTGIASEVSKLEQYVADSDNGHLLRLSSWLSFCPVSFYHRNSKVQGNPEYSLVYRGEVFLFASQEALELFQMNPNRYYHSNPPKPTHLKVLLLGPPLIGKTTQAKLLSERLGLIRIDVGELLSEEIERKTELGLEAFEMLSQGKQITPQLQCRIIKAKIDSHSSRKNEGGFGMDQGWILDGFPVTKLEAEAMILGDIIPTEMIVLEDETEGEGLVERSAKADHNSFPFDQYYDQYSETSTLHSFIAKNFTLDNVKFLQVAKKSQQEISSVLLRTLNPFFRTAFPVDLEDGEIVRSLDYSYLESFVPSKWMWGNTKFYCPLSLLDGNVIPGKDEWAAVFDGRLYAFAGDKEMERFLSDPAETVRLASQVVTPPPKILMIGFGLSKKKWLAKQVAQKYNLRYVSLQEETDRFLFERRGSSKLNEKEMVLILSKIFEGEKGVILEDDTDKLNSNHLNSLVELKKAIPDAVIHFQVSSEVAIQRLFDKSKQFDRWMEAQKKGSFPREEEEKLLKGIDYRMKLSLIKMVQQTLQSDDPEQTFELKEEDLTELLTNKVNDQVRETEEIELFFSERNIPFFEINDSLKDNWMLSKIEELLKPLIHFRESLFSFPIPSSELEAEDLLHNGTLSWSSFGKHCPVTYDESPQHFSPQSSVEYPVIYNNKVYYPSNESNRKSFLENAEKYSKIQVQIEFAEPIVPKCIIMGGELSGKSTLSKAISSRLGPIRLTITKILEMVRRYPTKLGREINKKLLSGQLASESEVNEATNFMLNTVQPQLRGWILDGFPYNSKQIKELNHHPNQVFCISISEKVYQSRLKSLFDAHNQRLDNSLEKSPPKEILLDEDLKENIEAKEEKNYVPFANIPHISQQRWAKAFSNLELLKSICERRFHNLTVLDGTKNKWFLYKSAEETIKYNLKKQHLYRFGTRNHLPVSVHTLDISDDFYVMGLAKSGFRTFCSVSLVNKGELFDTALLKRDPLKFVVSYNNFLFALADQEAVEEFMRNPEFYSTKSHLLPSKLPKILNNFQNLSSAEYGGHCPVSFYASSQAYSTEQYSGIQKTSGQFVVEYDGKYYSMVDHEAMLSMMRNPVKYSTITFPSKIPPEPVALSLDSLPISGYLEQLFATVLVNGLRELAHFRPKLPGLSSKESVLKFLSLYLKANNPSNNDFKNIKYSSKLNQFKEDCQVLTTILAETKGTTDLLSIHPDPVAKFDQIYQKDCIDYIR